MRKFSDNYCVLRAGFGAGAAADALALIERSGLGSSVHGQRVRGALLRAERAVNASALSAGRLAVAARLDG